MRVLLIAPYYDRNVPGESWSTYKWVKGICERHEVTVLTTHKKGWDVEKSPTKAKKVVNWTAPSLPSPLARLDRELKPTYFLFYIKARGWIKRALKQNEEYDLVHQINPLALRYPCPARGLGLKYIMGPLAGSLNTPEGFRSESSDKQWYRKLRNLDRLRIKHDPWLRDSYAGAAAVIGVAPYVEEILKPARIKRFEISGETGIESVSKITKSSPKEDEPLKLLYVGRIIRTKGVIDAIRAVAKACKSSNIIFDVVGDGDMLKACKMEVAALGTNDLVKFHGRVSRAEVNEWYKQAHVFLFPSFREPSGNVVFEAMSHGLPIITTTIGGPGFVVDESCGIKIEAKNPESFSKNLANAINVISSNRGDIENLSIQAIKRIRSIALWTTKHDRLESIYQSLND